MKKAIIIMTMIMSILLFEKVNASTFTPRIINNVSCKVDNTNWSCITDNYYTKVIFEPAASDIHKYTFNFTQQEVNTNSIVYVPIVIHRDGQSTGMTDYSYAYNSNSDFYITYTDEYDYYKFLVNVFLVSGNNTIPCILDNASLPNMTYKCPIGIYDKFDGISIETKMITSDIYNTNRWNFGIYRQLQVETDGSQEIINNQNQNYNDFKNQNATYTDEINTNMNGANETIQYSQNEERLLDSLDMNTSILDNINVNAGASAFIWDIVEGVRGMNPAIVTLMTSILGLGIAKMILNR